MGQSPHFYKKEERMYPRICATHARNLDRLNPGHEIVRILLRLLEWDHKNRITAPELVKLTVEMMEARSTQDAPKEQMDLEVPEGTRTVEFCVSNLRESSYEYPDWTNPEKGLR
ncbi:hypothetical protein FGRA07_04386 [Fusarium graminearum]|nr:hypothetical protein FGRA07_04386 [Fusarium graminearum]